MATRQRDYKEETPQGDHKGEGNGRGKGCPKATCCAELLAQLGAPDPLEANLYDLLLQIVKNEINIDLDVDTPLPDLTYFVSPTWSSPIDEDRQFTSLQAALDATDPNFNYTIIVHNGTYPAAVLPPNVTLKADARATIASLTFIAPNTPGPQIVRVFDFEIAGPVTIDTSAKADAAPVAVLFARTAFLPGFDFDATLRSSAGLVALEESDSIVIRESDLSRNNLDVTTVGGNLTIAQFIVLNSRISIFGIANIVGTAINPAFAAKAETSRAGKTTPVEKGRVIRKRQVASSSKTKGAKRLGHITQRAVLPIGAPVYSLYFEASNIDLFEFYNVNITNANTLLSNVFFASRNVDPVLVTFLSGILNAVDVTLNLDAAFALNGTQASLMHCAYNENQLTASNGGAADRDVNIGESNAALLAVGGAYGLVLTHLVPYVNDDYSVAATLVNPAVVAATLVLPVATVLTETAVELALSSTLFAGLLRYTINQRASPLAFL